MHFQSRFVSALFFVVFWANSLSYSYNGNRLAALSGSTVGTYSYDANGNMTHDGANNIDLEYNLMNLIKKASRDDAILANYSYLADGTKLAATDAAGDGLYYAGSLVYKKQGNSLDLESAAFAGGRFVVSETANGKIFTPQYHLTDHLGSTRVVVNADGDVLERNDYYPFGLRWADSGSLISDNRYRYNGKEEQDFVNVPFVDYGARMYDSRICHWLTLDPLLANHWNMSPFVFCGNNPIKMVDLFGLDYWYTNDPELIKAFFDNFLRTREWDMSGWEHISDNDFLARLSYNDETGLYYYSYNTIENGVITVNGMRFRHHYAGEIRPYKYNFVGYIENISKRTKIGKLCYNATIGGLDDAWIAIQSLFLGRTYPYHLNMTIATPSEKLNAGVSFFANLAFKNIGKFTEIPARPVNAAQFNVLYKGSGVTAATQGGQYIRNYNYVINNNIEYNEIRVWSDYTFKLVDGFTD